MTWRLARARCRPRLFCACWGRSRIASVTCSLRAARQMAAMARIRTACTSTRSIQVILKPPPENVQELYLESLKAIGIDLGKHDVKFEEDNWESPTLGAWGVGWQVMLDGLEVTQFTYFQQCGAVDLDPMCAELTYGLERIAAFLQDVDSIYDIVWVYGPDGKPVTYGDIRLGRRAAVFGLQLRIGRRGKTLEAPGCLRGRVPGTAGRVCQADGEKEERQARKSACPG